MATITGNTVEAASGSGGPVFVFDAIGSEFLPLTKIVFGADGDMDAAWSFNTGANDDGTGRVTLATDDPAVVALEAIEGYLDTEVAALVTAIQILDNIVSGNEAQVDIVSSALPSGASTSANQTTIIGHVDGIETLLGTIDADTSALAGAVDGTEMQVDIVSSALPTGAATDAKLDTLIGHVDTEIAALVTAVQILDNIVSGNEAQVDIVSSALPTGASTEAKQDTIIGHVDGIETLLGTIDADTGSILTAVQLLDNAVVDHGAAAVAGVRPIGLEARNTEPTAVDAGDAVRALATLLGKQVTIPYAIPASTWQYAAVSGGITDTADDVAKAAAGAGSRNYVTHASVVNAHDSVGTEVVIKSGSTIIWRGWAEQTGGGVAERFDPPLRGGDNEAINVTNITTGSQTYFNLQGYVAAE